MGLESNRNQLANPHSHTYCHATQAYAKTKAWKRVCPSHRTIKSTDRPSDEKEHRSDNIIYKQAGGRAS
jgi:hypothetical protein